MVRVRKSKPKTSPSGANSGRKYPCGGKLQKKTK